MGEEVWRDVVGYEGLYMVSNFGNVKSLERFVVREDGKVNHILEKLMKVQYNSKTGRPEVHLNKNGKRKLVKLYRIVAEAFIENDDVVNKTCVNHKDGCITNCKVDNLEWCTYSENLQHSYDELNRPINKTSIRRRNVITINKKDGSKNTYSSITQASKATGISCTQIRRIATYECTNENYIFIVEGLN